MTNIEPFLRQGNNTQIDNAVFDILMPTLSSTEWKVLCFILRKTIGWHVMKDSISYSQIKKGTGVKSPATISKALSTLESIGIITVIRTDEKWESNIYRLNRHYKLSTSKNELDSKNELEPNSKNEVVSNSKNEHTKEREKKEKEIDGKKNDYLAVCNDVENKLGIMPTIMLENSIKEAIAIYPESWITAAIDTASKNKARSWRYVEVVLEKWQQNGKQDDIPKKNGKQVIPDNLNTDMFRTAWKKWQVHMKEKGRPLTPTSSELQLQELSEWGEDKAIEAINGSIRKGWLGIYVGNENKQTESTEEYIGYLVGRH